MLSAREGLELASDPHYRVVVFVIDRSLFDLPRWQMMREDLRDFLESQAGPRDLVGLITTDRPWTDLVLGRRIQSIVDEISTPEWLHAQPAGTDGGAQRMRAGRAADAHPRRRNLWPPGEHHQAPRAGARRSHQSRVHLGRPGHHAPDTHWQPSGGR